MNPWQILKTKLQSEIDRLRDDLEAAKTWDDVQLTRGALNQARELLQFVEDSSK
jgi:hypothetical protein